MKCIFCGNTDSKVIDSRYLKDTSIRRRRECLRCGKRFTTYDSNYTDKTYARIDKPGQKGYLTLKT